MRFASSYAGEERGWCCSSTHVRGKGLFNESQRTLLVAKNRRGVFLVAPRASANELTVVAANVLQRQMSVAEADERCRTRNGGHAGGKGIN